MSSSFCLLYLVLSVVHSAFEDDKRYFPFLKRSDIGGVVELQLHVVQIWRAHKVLQRHLRAQITSSQSNLTASVRRGFQASFRAFRKRVTEGQFASLERLRLDVCVLTFASAFTETSILSIFFFAVTVNCFFELSNSNVDFTP